MSASSTTNADTVSDLQVDDNRKFFEKPPLVPPYTINENTIFIAIDPNGGASASGASGSETAIVSFIVSSGRVVVSFFVCACFFSFSIVRVDYCVKRARNARRNAWQIGEICGH